MHEALQWPAAYCFLGIREIQSPRWAALVLAQFTAEHSSVVQGGFPNKRNHWGNWESVQEPTAHATTPLWAYAQDNNLTWSGIVLYTHSGIVRVAFPLEQSCVSPWESEWCIDCACSAEKGNSLAGVWLWHSVKSRVWLKALVKSTPKSTPKFTLCQIAGYSTRCFPPPSYWI